MKIKDIRALSTEEIRQQIAQEKDALSRLKFAHAISPIENPLRIRTSRKLIARLLTELNAR
ncbi:50S ribosomal protein L29 [Siphonobacter sp. BAB-5385]|uniref:Large ribosomal subunit protein uL29 n=1 Tax=Siphonobacter curvatus TaxID=2094562 RepID=A0A2S7IKP0_9BACT|nr:MULTISPECIES: 50S ribosomal protein L29 [Siphonobacter]OZI05627.1 50S ribosomal protein L29 [Siphonobacter sp. BAB-5385]PMD98529.1 50S ribosomal protein L29 [Siphonobacter sp. BAB-5405]PQA58226.1 50S ribosomal protein L29 [Siphonobacter curvatus]